MLKKVCVVLATLLVASGCGSSNNESFDVGARLFRENGDSIFKLTIPSNPRSGGTGFSLITPSGHKITVTNGHVCDVAENGKLRAIHHNDVMEDLDVIAVSPTTDLCILSPSKISPPLVMAQAVRRFGQVNVLGHPFLRPLTYASGYIVNRYIMDVPDGHPIEMCALPKESVEEIITFFGKIKLCFMHIDAYDTSVVIYPGNSGSPAMNDDGDVIGVVFAGDNYTHWGAFIPLDKLKEFVKEY